MNKLEILLIITVFACLFYGIDDLIVDAMYWGRSLYRFFIRNRLVPLRTDKLNLPVEQKTAVLLPCWKEDEVVGDSLRNTLFTLRYSNYDVFVGVYPNDPETMAVVHGLQADLPNLKMIVCPNPGPTSKADNLNSIIQGALDHERVAGVRYEIFVMHDAEDVIHPLSLKLYNYLIPKKDMVQIPVFPLEVPLKMFTHWTYADEFAENHTKDILTREMIGGLVPSAGVGTAFSRNAIERMAEEEKVNEGKFFNTATLTEDYSFSLKLKKLNLKSIFVQQAFLHIKEAKRWVFFGKPVLRTYKEWIATRALFPVRYAAAVRQKSRWILGISLQEWKESGWTGSAATRYTLFRDRKGPLGHLICLLGYFFLGLFIHDRLVRASGAGVLLMPSVTLDNSFFWMLLLVNLVFMSERILQRMIAVWRIYGPAPAFFSAPRVVYGNIINAHAFIIALLKFWTSLKTGRRPAWSKTSNVFPTAEQLSTYRRRLGDVLLDSSLITPAQLKQALLRQSKEGKRLGDVLVEGGYISEEKLVGALGTLYSMNVVDLYDILSRSPNFDPELPSPVRDWLEKQKMLPLPAEEGNVAIAMADPTNEELKHSARRLFPDKKVQFVLAQPTQLLQVLADHAQRNREDRAS